MTADDERARQAAPSSGAAEIQSRTVLDKAARENFPVAPFFLPRAVRRDLMAVYGYARLVDDIGDGDLAPGRDDASWLGLTPRQAGDRLAMLDAFQRDLLRVFEGGTPGHPLLDALRPTVAAHRLSPDPFLALIEANRQDQRVRRYDTWDQLMAYCELSAHPVGHLVLRIAGAASPERIRCSDAVCGALQVVEHLQDVAEDLARDRIYLPAEDMARFGVAERDLSAATANQRVRSLVSDLSRRTGELLDAGIPLVAGVRGRLRLLLAGFVAGGRAALGAIAAVDHDVLPGPPKPSRTGVLRELAAVLRGDTTRSER